MGCCNNATNDGTNRAMPPGKSLDGVFPFEIKDLEGYELGTVGEHADGKKAILFVNVASF